MRLSRNLAFSEFSSVEALLRDEDREVLAGEEIDVPREDRADQPPADRRSTFNVWMEGEFESGGIESWSFFAASWIRSSSVEIRIGASITDSLVLVIGGGNWLCSLSAAALIGASHTVSLVSSLVGCTRIWIVWRKCGQNHGRWACGFIRFRYAEYSLKFPGTMAWELALANGSGGDG